MKNCVLISPFVLLAGCERADLPPTTFHSDTTPESTLDANHRGESLLFQNPSSTEVPVEVDQQRSVLQLDAVDSFGAVSVNRDVASQRSDADSEPGVMPLIRQESASDASINGLSTAIKGSELELNELLLTDAEPGDFSIEAPSIIGTENGSLIQSASGDTATLPGVDDQQ